jgi:hypothetical protein
MCRWNLVYQIASKLNIALKICLDLNIDLYLDYLIFWGKMQNEKLLHILLSYFSYSWLYGVLLSGLKKIYLQRTDTT